MFDKQDSPISLYSGGSLHISGDAGIAPVGTRAPPAGSTGGGGGRTGPRLCRELFPTWGRWGGGPGRAAKGTAGGPPSRRRWGPCKVGGRGLTEEPGNWQAWNLSPSRLKGQGRKGTPEPVGARAQAPPGLRRA